MKMSKCSALFAALSLLATGPVLAADTPPASVPLSFSHHGILWDGDELANGEFRIKATLYDGAGVAIAASDNTSAVNVEDGFYSVTIADIDSAKLAAAAGNVTLGLQVENDPELTPRIKVNAVPFAILAAKAESAAKADKATNAESADFATSASKASQLNCTGCVGQQHIDPTLLTSMGGSGYGPAAYGQFYFSTSPGSGTVAAGIKGKGLTDITWNNTDQLVTVKFDSNHIMPTADYMLVINLPNNYTGYHCVPQIIEQEKSYFTFKIREYQPDSTSGYNYGLCGTGNMGYGSSTYFNIFVYAE